MLYATMGRFPEAIGELEKSHFAKPLAVSGDAKGYLELMMTEEWVGSLDFRRGGGCVGRRKQPGLPICSRKAYSNGGTTHCSFPFACRPSTHYAATRGTPT